MRWLEDSHIVMWGNRRTLIQAPSARGSKATLDSFLENHLFKLIARRSWARSQHIRFLTIAFSMLTYTCEAHASCR